MTPLWVHHPGHVVGHAPIPSWIAGALVVGGMALLASSLYADRTEAVDETFVDVGVIGGVVVAAVGLAAFWI